MTQTEQVIATMRGNGGFATFGKLNALLDFSLWGTKTPEATVRRIVQDSPAFFKIEPGLWALTECRDLVLKQFKLYDADKTQKLDFSHSYYQGLVVEIGNMKHLNTCIPSQDKNKLFLEKPLKEISSLEMIYDFTYPEIMNRAKTVDVIWFNERRLPNAFFEIEHSTNIEHSLVKFYELQDYFAKFYIVADEYRHHQFIELIEKSIFDSVRERVSFVNYDNISTQHTQMSNLSRLNLI
jgi:hypothetical protein